jgi:hypothetical protein
VYITLSTRFYLDFPFFNSVRKIPYLGSEPVVSSWPGDLFHLGIFHRVRVRTPGELTAGRLAAPPPLLTQPLLATLHQRVVRVALVLQAGGFVLVLQYLIEESFQGR